MVVCVVGGGASSLQFLYAAGLKQPVTFSKPRVGSPRPGTLSCSHLYFVATVGLGKFIPEACNVPIASLMYVAQLGFQSLSEK